MITIITKLPPVRPNRHSISGPYYMGYVNHMWNLYISSTDAVPATANSIDRNDWTICREVFASLRPVEQSLILARHNPNRANREDMFRDCCDTIGLSDQTACAIVQSIAKTIAEKRGLIAPRNQQDPGSHPNCNCQDPNRQDHSHPDHRNYSYTTKKE